MHPGTKTSDYHHSFKHFSWDSAIPPPPPRSLLGKSPIIPSVRMFIFCCLVFLVVWAFRVFFFCCLGGGRVLFFAVWAGVFFFFAVWAGDESSLTYRSAWLVFKRPNNKEDQTEKKKHGFLIPCEVARGMHGVNFHMSYCLKS